MGEVHDLHVWTITSGFEALSAHVVAEEGTTGTERLPEAIRRRVRDRFGIDHVTVQVEPEPCAPRGSGRC